jgi:hypothetical protein
MNSVSYGWWLDNLYQVNDPDIMVFGNGATTNEAQGRLISGAVTGMLLNGDDLTSTNGQNAAQKFLANPTINDVARAGQTFMPVEGNTGSSAVDTFVRQDGSTWCIVVFNYTSNVVNKTVNLSRAGLPPGTYFATNLWDGTTLVTSNSMNVSLNPKQSKLFRLATYIPSNPASPPVINKVAFAGNNIIFSGTNGVANTSYVVLSSTSLTAPRNTWVPLTTNSFDANGAFSITNAVNPGAADRFYRLQE